MIVAAHQPNYLPWLGFFDKLRRCDKFLILDHVQFERQNFQNRAKIRFGEEARWLTVPVVQNSRDELILDKQVSNDRTGRLRWGRKQFATIEQVYRGCPYFHAYGPGLREILETRWDKLIDLNLALLRYCMNALNIRTPIVRTSELGPIPGQKSELVLNMCKAAGASVYLSGDGASKGYLDAAAFAAAGVEIRWQGFKHPDYPQGRSKTLHGLSVIDLLFNCGPMAAAVLAGGGTDGVSMPRTIALPNPQLPTPPIPTSPQQPLRATPPPR